MADDLAHLRLRLAGILPERIMAAMADYEDFANSEPPADSKGFAAWHAAAKAALSHADLLVRLARWAEGSPDAAESSGDSVGRLLSQARAALGAIDDGEEGE
ncbi:hypothetical protein [Magnetospirillum sp. SS-4]|uniref:hypothetical protein n=1 Tax=Magnetospirillum sp. SS-4 TaxID=2681465 RepID=UPI00137E142A|nr:hypothetical protein [Magnetospirillum sp. SS-4]CAA7612771.1 conserved hypothetical protein [Magnetospirillum sp. SS-4]